MLLPLFWDGDSMGAAKIGGDLQELGRIFVNISGVLVFSL